MLRYIETLNIIKLSIKHKKKTIKIAKTKRIIKILLILLKLNLILGWTENINNSNTYVIYCNNSIKKNIHIFVKPTQYFYIKYKFYKKFFTKKFNVIIYLSTSSGIISLAEAYKKNIGGILLFGVY